MKNFSRKSEERSQKGFLIKGFHRIRNIRSRRRDRIKATFWSAGCARLMRRSFYWISAHIFFAVKNPLLKDDIREMIHMLRQEASLLAQATARYPFPDEAKPCDAVSLVVVGDDGEDILDIFLMADRALIKFEKALGHEKAAEMFSRFFRAYGRLERHVKNITSHGSAVYGSGKDGSAARAFSNIQKHRARRRSQRSEVLS